MPSGLWLVRRSYVVPKSARIGAVRGSEAESLPLTATTVLPGPARSRVPVVSAALVLGTVGFMVMLVTKPGGSDWVVRVSDAATALAAVSASVICALAGRRHADSMRAFWWLLAAACGAWACGEVIWTVYEVILRVPVPYPSWADVGYLAGTPLAVAAFACHPAAHSHHRRSLVPLLDGVAVASALLFVSWTLVLGPLWNGSEGKSLGDLVSVAYPFGDVVILVLVILALRNLQPGNRLATATLLGGLVAMAVSDTAYTYLVQVGGYISGDLIDAGWFAAYLAIAAAALLYASTPGAPPVQAEPTKLISVLAANLPILAALGFIAVEVPRGVKLDRAEWAIALCLTVVVLARQLLFILRRRSAHRRLGRPSSASSPASTLPRPRATLPAGASPGPRSELHALTLQMAAAARPSAQERVQRVSSSSLMVLTSIAGIMAVWDLSLLIRGAG